MIDVEKHIAYWRKGATEDLESAGILVEKGRFRQGLFFAHLAIEKTLKAHVTRITGEVPPKTHNLPALAAKTKMSMPNDISDALLELNLYQMEGRYPGESPASIDASIAEKDLNQASKVVKWLNQQFPQ